MWLYKMRVETEKPIAYGPWVTKDEKVERLIRFLEDPINQNKPVPENLLVTGSRERIASLGRARYAEYLRQLLQGGVIG